MSFSMIEINARLRDCAEQIARRVFIDAMVDESQAYLPRLVLELTGTPHLATVFIGDGPKETLAAVTKHDSRAVMNVLDFYVELRNACFSGHDEWIHWVDSQEMICRSVSGASRIEGSALPDEYLTMLRDNENIKENILSNPWVLVFVAFGQITVSLPAPKKGPVRDRHGNQ